MIADFIFFVEDLVYEHVTFQKFLWFNRNIKVDNRPIFFKYFSEKELISFPILSKKMAK